MRVVVAGFGNVLRGDDGFGVAVAGVLAEGTVPAQVEIADVGIGGIHLVQLLLDPVDGLIVVDALDVGRSPGSVFVMRPDVRKVAELPPQRRRDELADMHFATPERAMMLADSFGVLPAATVVVGCQVSATDHLGEGLSPSLAVAVEPAAAEVRRIVTELGVAWS